MNAIPRIATAALLLALLAGCGNKGPLVLPTAPADTAADTVSDDPAPVEPAPAEPAPPVDADTDVQDAAEPPVDAPADGDGRR